MVYGWNRLWQRVGTGVDQLSFEKFVAGEESIPRGLKPDFEAESNAEAKASAYPRGKGKDKGQRRDKG